MPYKKLLFTFLSFSLTFLIHGQNFSSNLEKEIFSSYAKDSINYDFIESLFAMDSIIDKEEILERKEKIKSLIKTFPEKENSDKKEKKRIKKIYNSIHDTFFTKYNLNSYFSDIFKDGTYNCVTATAMYAYVFDELNIPYHIKETPSHVFLIAYPNSFNIYLETTAPGAYGFSIPKEPEVKKIIDELIAYKIVTKNEVNEKGYMQFYEDYYYGKEFIDKSALIGMQYYNKGLSKLESLDYDTSLNNFRKAKTFYSSPLIKPLLKSIMFVKVNELVFNSLDDIDFLIELLSIANYPKDYSLSNLKSSLYKIVEHDDNDSEFILNTIEKFRSIKNDKVKNEAIEFLYEYLGRKAASNSEYDEAIIHADSILKINSNSKIAKEIVEFTIFRKVAYSLYDIKALNSFLESSNKYEFLKTDRRYFISLAHFYGNLSLMNYKSKSITTAKNYRDKFEDIMDTNNILDEINKVLIVDLYLRAGNYYYYKGKYQSSYNIYNKGLTYIPNHPDLMKRAQWSKDEL
ncbi:hypothetical protein [Hyunsoonleella ulvae]|uniref:hypothetical protein n=1 Tax=Hyunsoonleella ulvae TaxID=2799948 RepID=UPI00193ADD7B|nr:hypothetical protein [Hyunsoonleella ulvae]